MYGETLLQTLPWIQPLNDLKMCLLKVHILLGGSQHAQFMLADNADMDVTEITAALGCKFFLYHHVHRTRNQSLNVKSRKCSHFDTV